MSKSVSSSCSEEDTAANRQAREQSELSKADFLGWIVAKCKLLRENSKTFFEFRALEAFSDLVAAVLVKAYESGTVESVETLYRSLIDEIWTKLEEQKKNNRRGIQDIAFIWPFVKEFVDEIAAWKERQQQAQKDFFIRRAFQESKNASPPVLITTASPGLIDDDGPRTPMAMLRKRRSAEERLQSPNASVVCLGAFGECSPPVPNWRALRKEENRGGNEQLKKRRTEEEEEQRKGKANAEKSAIKQEVIEVDDEQQQQNDTAKEVPTKVGTARADKGMGSVSQEKEKQQQKDKHQEEGEDDDEELYSLSFGNKAMFELEEEPQASKEPMLEEQHLLKEVKHEPEENGSKESEGRGREEEEEANGNRAMAGLKESDQQQGEEDEQTEEDDEEEEEGEVTESDGTDSPPPPADSGGDASSAQKVVRPYSPLKPGLNSSSDIAVQCKREISTEHDDAVTVSPQKRSEFDIFDHPISQAPKPASPAKTGQRTYSGKVKIRKRSEYEAEQKLKRQLAIRGKALRFSGDTLIHTFIIDEGNVMSRPTANEKSPFFITSTTVKFLKKQIKSKNDGKKRRRHLDAQLGADVRDVVAAVKERCTKLLEQLNSSTDGDDLATARGERLVRFSRLLLTDSLLQRLDEDALKNAYVLRALEHPRDIELFVEKGLNSNAQFLRNASHLAYFEFSYLFVFYGHDQIVHCQRVPDPAGFLVYLRTWFVDHGDQIKLKKSFEDENQYYYTHPRIVAVTVPEVGECASHFRVFNDHLRLFVSADKGHSKKTGHNDRFLLLDWAQLVAQCSDGIALDSEEKRMQILAKEMKEEFGVLIK